MPSITSNDFVLILFALVSLVPAFVLFKFLESTAIIKKKNYQAGGAIAGYIIVLAALFAVKVKLEATGRDAVNAELKQSESRYAELLSQYKEATTRSSVAGTVRPVGRRMRVALAIDDKPADTGTGAFRRIGVKERRLSSRKTALE